MNILGIGTDIIECLRVARMIERHGEQFINRVYTPAETRYCQSRKQATQHFAAHWAAKEAVLRVLATQWRPGIGFRDIEIRYDKHGRPAVGLRGGVLDLAVSRGIREVLISLSHCRSHAVAYALAMGEAPATKEKRGAQGK